MNNKTYVALATAAALAFASGCSYLNSDDSAPTAASPKAAQHNSCKGMTNSCKSHKSS